MLTPVLLTLLLQGATLHCANPASAETPVLRSSSGIEASIKVDTHDDWNKNMHLCQADYTPTVMHPGRSTESADGIFGNDDAWGRSIAFRLEGFSQDQKEIFGILSERGKYPTLEIFAYHIAGQVADIADLTRAFLTKLRRRLSPYIALRHWHNSGGRGRSSARKHHPFAA